MLFSRVFLNHIDFWWKHKKRDLFFGHYLRDQILSWKFKFNKYNRTLINFLPCAGLVASTPAVVEGGSWEHKIKECHEGTIKHGFVHHATLNKTIASRGDINHRTRNWILNKPRAMINQQIAYRNTAEGLIYFLSCEALFLKERSTVDNRRASNFRMW